jgi:hypothetical protein
LLGALSTVLSIQRTLAAVDGYFGAGLGPTDLSGVLLDLSQEIVKRDAGVIILAFLQVVLDDSRRGNGTGEETAEGKESDKVSLHFGG